MINIYWYALVNKFICYDLLMKDFLKVIPYSQMVIMGRIRNFLLLIYKYTLLKDNICYYTYLVSSRND